MSSPELSNEDEELSQLLINNSERDPVTKRLGRLPNSENTVSFNPSSNIKDETHCTITQALDCIGVGRFHYILVIVIGWANASDSIETLCTSFLLPSARCELNMSTAEMGALNSAVFVGMMFGGYIWGSMADIYGRRSCLLVSLTFNGLAALGSSFVQSYWAFLTMRLISGIGVGGTIPVLFTYLYEFQPTNYRGMMGSFISTCWAAGNIIAAGLAWLIIPRTDLDIITSSGFKYTSWRMFVAVCALPSLTGALLIALFPESPCYLLSKGKDVEALNVIRSIYTWNTHRPESELWITRLLKSADDKSSAASYTQTALTNKVASCLSSVTATLSKTSSLFKKTHRNNFLIITTISVCLSFSYYGLWMWLPELINRAELSGGSVCSPVTDINITHSSNNCSTPVQPEMFIDTFITASASIPPSIITMFILDRVGASIVLGVCSLGAGVSVLFIWLIHNKTESVILSALFGAVIVPSFCASNLVTTVAFPTHIRSTAFGVISALTRISAVMGNVLFGLMVDINCAVPILTVASLLLGAALFAPCLPSTRGHTVRGH